MPAPQTWIFNGDFTTPPRVLSGAVSAWIDAVSRSVEGQPGGTVLRVATIPSTGTFTATCSTHEEFIRTLCSLSLAAIKAVAEAQQEEGGFLVRAHVEFDQGRDRAPVLEELEPAPVPPERAPGPAPWLAGPLRRFTLLAVGFGLLPLVCYQVRYPGALGALLVLPPAVLFGLIAAAAIEITRALVTPPEEIILDD